jgi:hypothetical protein
VDAVGYRLGKALTVDRLDLKLPAMPAPAGRSVAGGTGHHKTRLALWAKPQKITKEKHHD